MNNYLKVMVAIGILLTVYIIVTIIYYLIHNKYKSSKKDDEYTTNLIKVLQEIACDYRVRVIKSGWGKFTEPPGILMQLLNDKKYSKDKDFYKDSGCIDIIDTNIENYINNTNKELYFICFRVFGKNHLSYANNEIIAWANVVSKARERSRALFSRANYLDRHKI